MSQLFSESNQPILLEVFTDANTDASTLKNFWSDNRKEGIKGKIKKTLKGILSPDQIHTLKKLLKGKK